MAEPRNSVEGRVYRFRSLRECEDSQTTDQTGLSRLVRAHMVLVLDWKRDRRGYVEVMTITTKNKTGQHLPISPTPKRPYPLQLRLINPLPQEDRTGKIMRFTNLPYLSYLKVDQVYEIPLRALEEITDDDGNQLRLRLKGEGGIRQLRHYIRQQGLH